MIKQGDSIINVRTGQRMIFIKTWAETNGTQLQIECFSPPSMTREAEHIHPYQENRFTILSGVLCFLIEGREVLANPGDTVSIPRNTRHCFWNPGSTESHYIQEFFPALNTDSLFETFFALERDGKLNGKGKPNLFLYAVLMKEFKKTIRLAKPWWVLQKILIAILVPIGKLLGYRSTYPY